MKDIYVMNGFYMSMRGKFLPFFRSVPKSQLNFWNLIKFFSTCVAAYCNPGEKIQWYGTLTTIDTITSKTSYQIDEQVLQLIICLFIDLLAYFIN